MKYFKANTAYKFLSKFDFSEDLSPYLSSYEVNHNIELIIQNAIEYWTSEHQMSEENIILCDHGSIFSYHMMSEENVRRKYYYL